MSSDRTMDEIGEPQPNDSQETNDDTPSEPIYVDSAGSFAETVSAHDVVLVDFYADWCGPCKMIEPTMDAIAAETEAAVAKVDVDAHQQLAAEYGVQGVPTLLLFADGTLTERLVGLQSRDALTTLVDQYSG